MRVLSIIVTYNALKRDWLHKCMTSLLGSTYKTDIFVIDNHSSDGTADVISTTYPQVELYESKINLGFAKANNIGFEKALREGYDHVLLLNQDAWIESDTLDCLIKAHVGNQKYGILSPVHYNGENDNLEELFAHFLLRFEGEGRKFYFDNISGMQLKTVYELSYIHAACWLISRECFSVVGLFDDVLFKQYGEDDNYISRAKYFKFGIGLVSSAIVYHDTEFRKTDKTANEFDNTFLEFNVIGADIYKEDSIERINYMISLERANAIYYLKRLRFNQYRQFMKKYRLKIKQKELILMRRKSYLSFNADIF